MTQRCFTARWVLPMDGPPLSDGAVTIEGGVIVAVGDRRSAPGPVEDFGDVVLLPGLVNAHTHLEFSDLARPLGEPGMEFTEWIRRVIFERKRTNRDPQASIVAGRAESLRCGVTMLGDIATAPTEIDAPPNVLAFQEVIGFSAGRIESAFAQVCDRLDANRDLTDRRRLGISPHAPYSVHPQLLERLVEEAISRSLPVAMHLAESRAELELLAHGAGPFRKLLADRSMWDAAAIPCGCTPLDYLRTLSRAPRALVIHGNYLAPGEIEFLARHRDRMSVVYCPRTHAYFGHDRYPLSAMLKAGVRVALGTDSRASNPDLKLFGEIRAIVERHGLAPLDAMRLGTLHGAEALGWGDVLGSLTPGKRADLVAVPCRGDDPAAAVLAREGPPQGVWAGGDEISA